MEETKVCKVCGRELPLSKFQLSKSGSRKETCNECIASKSAETRRSHRIRGGGSHRSLFRPGLRRYASRRGMAEDV